MLIGICGKSGSGKSTLAIELKKIYGDRIIHLNIDKIGHKALTDSNVINQLINLFGKDIMNENIINRKKLGNMVFNSKLEMKKLSDITWNFMEKEIDRILDKNKDKIVILDWILLPKTKYFNNSDINVLLDIPYEIRKLRAMKRDNISEEEFNLREKASIEYNKDVFDLILNNNGKKDKEKLVKLL